MSKRRGFLHSPGRHLRDILIRLFPLEMRTEGGFTVLLRNRSELSVYYDIFVRRTYPLAACAGAREMPSSPVVLDVGANTGLFTAAVFDHWPLARVHAFEPQRRLIARIQEFAAINALQDRLVVNWCAIGATGGVANLYQNRNPISASLIRGKAARRSVRRVDSVPVMSLDQYLLAQDIRRVDILKLDVEGVELEALEGAKRALPEVRLLFIEMHPPFSVFSAVARRLEEAGLVCVHPVTPPEDTVQANCAFARRQ